MDLATAQLMSRLTCDFYRRVGESFSATRTAAWPGWEQVLDSLATVADDGLSLLDLACGNLRFERAVLARFAGAHAVAVDASDEMAQLDDARVDYLHRDIAALLLEDGALPASLGIPPADAAVSFAFMHHLPLFEQRRRLMEALVGAVRPGGVAAVSFWQFADDARLSAKARAATEAASRVYDLSSFGQNDYLMGWQDVEGAYRFCHHCTDEEIDGLLGAVAESARVRVRYRADGASGALNCYVVLRRIG